LAECAPWLRRDCQPNKQFWRRRCRSWGKADPKPVLAEFRFPLPSFFPGGINANYTNGVRSDTMGPIRGRAGIQFRLLANPDRSRFLPLPERYELPLGPQPPLPQAVGRLLRPTGLWRGSWTDQTHNRQAQHKRFPGQRTLVRN